MSDLEPTLVQARLRWYQGLTSEHWWVLCVGSLAWLFDTMDQRLFVLSRQPALSLLLGQEPGHPDVSWYSKLVTATMILGWAVGGLFFGIMGDRWGRVKTLSLSILVYSLFTGLSGLSVSWWDFCLYRFLMGGGIGGAFATAATLIAETLPPHSRAFALGLFQALSAVGNITGSAVARWWIVPGLPFSLFGREVPGWRVLFFFGVLPAILVVFILSTVREPQVWLKARATAKTEGKRQLGDLRSLLGHPTWRRNTLVGVGLGLAGVVGLWGVAFWSPELVTEVLTLKGASNRAIQAVRAEGTLLQDVGAFFGIFAFTVLATRVGRRVSFAISLVICYAVVVGVFHSLSASNDVYWMYPLMGFATLSIFGGYAIYFPEIYPTRLRATGTGFCYNVARVLAAVLIFASSGIEALFRRFQFSSPLRASAIALCTVYLLGLVVVVWAPETKDRPLPEE